MNVSLKVINQKGETLACAAGEKDVSLVYHAEYQENDCLAVECGEAGQYLVLQLDDAMAPTLVYLKNKSDVFYIPFGEKRISYSPRAFTGDLHLLSVRLASPDEINIRRNLALNPLDTHENQSMYPHASANVETRGEAVFAARNAIDGVKANTCHGKWPFSSWGINRDPNAAFKLEFGRKVKLEEAVFYLRADFPHDAWWESAAMRFSDGSSMTIVLKKTEAAQSFSFEPKTVEWVVLDTLIKAEDASPFPALTQIEFYGTEA